MIHYTCSTRIYKFKYPRPPCLASTPAIEMNPRLLQPPPPPCFSSPYIVSIKSHKISYIVTKLSRIYVLLCPPPSLPPCLASIKHSTRYRTIYKVSAAGTARSICDSKTLTAATRNTLFHIHMKGLTALCVTPITTVRNPVTHVSWRVAFKVGSSRLSTAPANCCLNTKLFFPTYVVLSATAVAAADELPSSLKMLLFLCGPVVCYRAD